MRMIIFLLIFLSLRAMDQPRSQTPPVIIPRAVSPGTQIRNCTAQLIPQIENGLSSSPERMKSLEQQHKCPKIIKVVLEKELSDLLKKLKTSKNKEDNQKLLKEYYVLHYAWMQNQCNNFD